MPVVDVYADLLFLINAAMDGLCLLGAARLCHRPLRGWRLTVATVLGGLYAVLALLLPDSRWLSLTIDIGVCILMCAIAFGARRLPSVTAVYIALSMALGGVMTALYNLLNRSELSTLLSTAEDGAGAWLFLLLTTVGMVITLRGGHFWKRSTATRYVTVTITLGDRTVNLRGLVDTGNLLCDPLDGRAVICVDRQAAAPLLSPALNEVAAAMAEGHSPAPDTLTNLPEAHRLRLVPAGSATGASLLLALRPDCVRLAPAEPTARHPHAPCEVDTLIALIPSPEGDFEALIPAALWGD